MSTQIKTNQAEVNPKGLSGLPAAADSAKSAKSPNPLGSGGPGGSPAITYGFFVEAKLKLYELQDLLNELQETESKMTQQQYKLQRSFGKGLAEGITQSYTQQAQGLSDAATGMIIGAVGTGVMAGAEGVSMKRNSSKMSQLEDEQTNIGSYKTAYENAEPSDNPLSTRPATIGPKTAEETDAEQRIADHKQGKFEKPFGEKLSTEANANKRAAELSSADEQKEVVAKAKEQLEANALEQQKVSASGQRLSNLMQMSGQAINGIAQGSGQAAQASETAAQASSETQRALAQSTLQMINPGDTYKQMDSFQQDSVNILQIIQGLENANKYQPAS